MPCTLGEAINPGVRSRRDERQLALFDRGAETFVTAYFLPLTKSKLRLLHTVNTIHSN
jgi:hypothetical protein